MALDRFVNDLGKTVEQDASSLVSDVKREFSADELKSLVTQSITKGIASCDLERSNKADDAKPKAGSTLAYDIRQITKQIRGSLDCVKIQQEVKKQLDNMEEELKGTTDAITKKLEEVFPLIKVPLNPFKLPKFIVKQTIGRVLPDLKAALDFLKRAIELVTALADLAAAIEEVIPRLEACALSIEKQIFSEIQNLVQEGIDNLKKEISDAIADAICNGLKDAKVTQSDLKDAFEVIDSVTALANNIKSIKSSVENTIEHAMGMTSKYSSDLQGLTGITPPFDTSNTQNFMASLNSDSYTQYISDITDVYNSPEPELVTIPTITGEAYVGETLQCSNGVWAANGVVTSNTFTHAFQWYRGGVEIYGANTSTYVPVIDDVEASLFCIVTAETPVTIETAQTANTAPVQFQLTGTNRPVISGTPIVNQTLTCSTGTWPTDVFTYYYEWVRDGSTVVKARSANNQYTVQLADQNTSISCKVFAQTTRFILPATANSVAIVAPPTNTVPPVITGTPTVGQTLSSNTGVWSSSGTTNYAYQWTRDSFDIFGATSNTYTLTGDDLGAMIGIYVTATNIAGFDIANATPVGPVT